jgi:iron donor protein CyaY
MMMEEQEFKTQASLALEQLFKALTHASESREFEADMNNGALTVEFEEPPAKFVVSPNTPVRQIWVSAHSKSFKLDWNAAQSRFVLPATGQTLAGLISEHVSTHLGEEVPL